MFHFGEAFALLEYFPHVNSLFKREEKLPGHHKHLVSQVTQEECWKLLGWQLMILSGFDPSQHVGLTQSSFNNVDLWTPRYSLFGMKPRQRCFLKAPQAIPVGSQS